MKSLALPLALVGSLAVAGCGGRECYVGVRGSEASITVRASFPGATCDALIKRPADYIGDIAEGNRREFYAMSEKPTQPAICEYTLDGKRFIVRDDGLLKLVGNVLCSGLARRAD